ncbi:MAG: hypothetical protein MI756_02680 [Chromatiales bacterium]|nr:hypothetical protein [Chromatiales bacterium]
MQKLQLFSIALSFALLTGCNDSNNSESNTEQSPLVGQWVTESCDLLEDREADTRPLWAKGHYTFTPFQTIYYDAKIYYDSDCTVPHITVENPEAARPQPAIYQDLGETMLAEGIIGRGLFVEFNFAGDKFPVDGFFTINQDGLCLSELFTFEAVRFGTNFDGSRNIDFEACLTRDQGTSE